jgi:hypothetical protein
VKTRIIGLAFCLALITGACAGSTQETGADSSESSDVAIDSFTSDTSASSDSYDSYESDLYSDTDSYESDLDTSDSYDSYDTYEPTDTYEPEPTAPETVAPPGSAPPDDQGGALRAGTWQVTISGTVSGRNFQRTGTVVVGSTVATSGTTTEVNPIEVCLKSGFPAGTPEIGAIWLGTTSACFPTRGADLDLATVDVSGNDVTVAPDSQVAATLNNGFNALGGVTACIYAPDGGQATYHFNPDGSLDGTIDITGFGGACGQVGGTSASYRATITGSL